MIREITITSLILAIFTLLILLTGCESTNPIIEDPNILPPNPTYIPEESPAAPKLSPDQEYLRIETLIEKYVKTLNKDGISYEQINQIVNLYLVEVIKVSEGPYTLGGNYENFIRVKPRTQRGSPLNIGSYPSPIVKISFDEYYQLDDAINRITTINGKRYLVLLTVKVMGHKSHFKKESWTFKLKWIPDTHLPSTETEESSQNQVKLPPNPKLIEGINVKPSN